MFFNLSTSQIEDFTSRGLQDLAEGFIRTPIDPVQTFLDDPLRVLRAVRFAGRFRFRVDPALVEAASSSSVHVCILISFSFLELNLVIDSTMSYLIYSARVW